MRKLTIGTLVVLSIVLFAPRDGLLQLVATPAAEDISLSNQLVSEVNSLIQTSLPSISTTEPVTVLLPNGITLDMLQLTWDVQHSRPRSGLLRTVLCYACRTDCIYNHNQYGGDIKEPENVLLPSICKCHQREQTGEPRFDNVVGNCGSLTRNSVIDGLIVRKISYSLRLLLGLEGCYSKCEGDEPVVDNPGCKLDSRIIHGMTGGSCGYTSSPIATLPGDMYPGYICNFS